MKANGERFEEAFNRIDALLRKKHDKDGYISFAEVVRASSDATVHAYRNDLLEYGDLTNAIVHDRGRAPFLIADPRDDVVRRIELILDQLSQPRILRSIPCHARINIFTVDQSLPKVLAYMRANKFSQVITKSEQKFVILSVQGIALWLEQKATEDIISLVETKLGEVLGFEPKDTCIYLSAGDTIDAAREKFANDIGKKVESALISEHGRSSERPINIITPWDFVAGALKQMN